MIAPPGRPEGGSIRIGLDWDIIPTVAAIRKTASGRSSAACYSLIPDMKMSSGWDGGRWAGPGEAGVAYVGRRAVCDGVGDDRAEHTDQHDLAAMAGVCQRGCAHHRSGGSF